MTRTPPVYSYGETLLRVEGVSRAYGKLVFKPDGTLDAAEKLILYDVNFNVRNRIRSGNPYGEVLALLGPSGIGKSQLFEILAGLNPPTTGQVLLNSEGTPVHPGMVGVVAQSYPLLENRRVLGNLVVAGRQAGMKKKEAIEKAMAYLETFGLTEKANEWPRRLSGGQRQRVAICQQLMCSERFLLMDEPFSGQDVLNTEKTISAIQKVAASSEVNVTIIVTHDVSSAIAVADRLLLLGRDRDKDGNPIPGARIVEEYDLVDMGLAWQPDITQTSEFLDFVKQIKLRFHEL